MKIILRSFIENPLFARFIIAVIIINAIALGFEATPSLKNQLEQALFIIDKLVLIIFVTEMTLKLFVYRLSFFKSGWNIFDLSLVIITALPFFAAFSAFKTFRVLRVLRLLSAVPQMRLVVRGFFEALPGLFSVVGILGIFLYISSVIATKTLSNDFPHLFGSLGTSLFTFFQIMTLEGWTGEIVRPVMELYPIAGIFFISFIVITTFAILNLVIGVIVNAMQKAHDADQEVFLTETHSLEKEILSVRTILERIEKKLPH